MCGIAGYVGETVNPEKCLTEMAEALNHRGPDDSGIWFDKGKLVDYDGIFALPAVIINQLKKWGFEVEEYNEED